MIAEQEARERAAEALRTTVDRLWVAGYDFGWVIHPVVEQDPDNPQIGGASLVVDTEGGLTWWPSRHPDEIAHRFRCLQASRGRFPEDVEEELRWAGWRPERDIGEELLETVPALLGQEGSAEQLRSHVVAQRALREFGMLFLQQTRDGRTTSIRLYPTSLEVLPDPGWTPDPAACTLVAEVGAPAPISPIGVMYDESGTGELIMDQDGAVYLVAGEEVRLFGRRLDEALIHFLGEVVEGAPEPQV